MLSCSYLFHVGHSLTDTFKLNSKTFYFTQLDAEATQLHLTIITAQYLHISVWFPTCKVARTINSETLVFYKAFGCHLGQVVIATSHTRSTNQQFASKAHRQLVSITIYNKFLIVQQWVSNSYLTCMRQVGYIRRNGNLRRSIGIKYMNTHRL